MDGTKIKYHELEVKATKLNTFTTMGKKTNAKTNKGQVVKLRNDLKFITRLLAVGKARNVDMMEVLTYSLRKYPSPIATVEGKLVKTPKAKLLHILEGRLQDPLTEEFSENNALVLDGMALANLRFEMRPFWNTTGSDLAIASAKSACAYIFKTCCVLFAT